MASKTSSSSISRRKKKLQKLLLINAEVQRYRCCYCLQRFDESTKNLKATLEHIKPRSKFLTITTAEDGTLKKFIPLEADSFENTAAACWLCNNKRQDIPAMIFYEQELWKSTNSKQRLLWQLKMHFLREPSKKILRRMGAIHVSCTKAEKSLGDITNYDSTRPY